MCNLEHPQTVGLESGRLDDEGLDQVNIVRAELQSVSLNERLCQVQPSPPSNVSAMHQLVL